jgi:hypothetical protein
MYAGNFFLESMAELKYLVMIKKLILDSSISDKF